MNELNELNEQNEQPEQPALSLTEAALRLGLSRDAVRMRVARGRLRGIHAGREWRIYLNGAERSEQNSSHNRTNGSERFVPMFADQAARIADLEADKAWLQAEVERRGVELAEMRRLLGNAQQQYALLTAGEMPDTTAAAAVKGRLRWAERLAAMFGRS